MSFRWHYNLSKGFFIRPNTEKMNINLSNTDELRTSIPLDSMK